MKKVNHTVRENFLLDLLDKLTKFGQDFDCLTDKDKFCLEIMKNSVFFAYVKEPNGSLEDSTNEE